MRTNLFKSMNIIRCVSGASLNLFRYATMVLVLLLGMSESAWGASYYSQFTAKSGNTAQGLVYAAGSNSEGGLSSYTNQVTPNKDDGSSGAEYTWYAWAKAARGYQFKTWTKGSNINSNGTLTDAATTFGVKHSTSDYGTTAGDATATFEAATAYTITYKKPENFGGYTAEYANYTISNNAFVDYSKTITMTSSSSNTNETSYVSDKVTLTATDRVANFLGWYSGSTLLSTKADGYSFNPNATTTIEGRWEDVTTHLNMTFKAVELDDSSNPKGYYTVGGTTVSTSDVVVNTEDLYYLETTLTATPAEGYVFTGWYTKEGKKRNFISYDNPFNAYFDQETTLYASFSYNNYTDDQKAQFKVGSTPYTDLNAANAAAAGGSNKTIVCTRDGILPPGNYTISNGVKLYIPYSSSESSQTTPAVVTTAAGLSVYRKLVMTEGANITVENGGVISVGGQIMSASGGSPSAYPTGACGMIDMSKGGHIELNNGATLYVWGFIKGQDMDQGNNTLDVGTITANSGSNIWEDFWLADWRGGSACSCLAMNDGHMMFPFQGYTMQNIEVPTLYNYGATLNNYINVYGNKKTNAGTFATIGSENTLFLLKDAKSKVCKWYDPTTDLVCYELTGTTQIDALNVDAGITEVSSAGFNLPITSNMHVILNSDITISKPITILPGAVLEIKSGFTATISDNLYMYDTDDWGKGVLGYYFYPFSNLTSHKSRGTGSANDLEDAKLVVDGTLNVTGKIYSTTGGSNIMGNGGGKVTLPSVLYGSPCLYQAWGGASGTQTSTTRTLSYWAASTDTYVEPITVNSANLYNEDGSYTQSAASTTFYNVNGRWFAASAKDEKANHTYDFTYISSGAVSGAGGTNTTTDAVYSNDKTGLELRMKWANVTADACSDWWQGQGVQAGWFYNWTMHNAWHQFQSTETEGLYSGSNNTLYTKSDCTWEELGSTDINCLYTIDGKKKALVAGHFIELEPNSDDAAFHEAADPTKYYICFEGCNWHAATKYEGEKKAYVVDETTFIWYEERWMAVEREEPFFYTKDETNVTIYYEYIGSEWVLAQPYVEVTDATETRQLLRFNEAITVASAKKNATIKLLRDFVNITTPMTFTGANTTCTLDLNGYVAEVHVVDVGNKKDYSPKMLTLNGAGTTFTIIDNTTDKKGELKLIASCSSETNTYRWSGIYVQNGSLVLQSGKVYVEHPFAWVSNSNTGFISGILVASAKTFTMNGGTLHVEADYNPYGINAASGTPTVNIHGGTIECVSTTKSSPYGIIGYGTINIDGGYIHANAKANSTAKAVYANVSSSAKGTINISGGRLYAESTSSACGVHCAGTAAVTGDYNATTPNNTPKARYYAVVNITGGEITAVCRTSTTSYGVLSYGTTTISGGTITSTVQKSNQNTAYGVCTIGGTTTISAGANITANAPTIAYGVTATAANGDSNRGWPHMGVVNITGGTIIANTTNTTTAYGLLVTGTTWTINLTNSYKVFNGDYAAAGTATVTGGTFKANAKTTLARGIAVAATKTKNEASATPTCTINGGYYQMTGTGDVLGCNASALAADFHINGGYYSHNGNLATYAASPKHVLTLASGDANRPPYYYKVAEAYLVTFKNEDGTANIIDPVYQEVGTAPVCSTEPTKESTSTNSFTFDGWATEANGAKVYEPNGLPNVTSAGATYYAHFATTTLKYRVHFDAAANGGECATENIYVNPGTAVGSLPTATKYGYTFNGWYTASTGGTKLEATTVINADADYYAQFTANSHTLTWDLAGGTVSTAGKIGSTTWPAKNATGTPSTSVAFGTILTTIPVVTKTGYTFNRWDPIPTSSMPDENVTYTALWNPATNTKYYVKHYQQNIDDNNYTLVETDNLTGTTDATVTPDRKSYDGFLTPGPQQLTIGAASTTELAYYYDRVVYTINWNASANGGSCATASTDVRHGANIALPAATKAGHILEGWYTKEEGGNKISDGAAVLQNYGTLYAQFVPTYTIIWNDENGNELSREEKLIGESLTPPDYSKEDTQEWDYTFHGWNDGTTTYAANAIPAVSGAATYTADITKEKNNYTLTIGVVEAGYGSVNETSVTVPYGTSVSTSGNVLTIGTTTVTATPTASNAQYTYEFDHWNNVPETVTGNVNNIQAVFTRTLNTVTVMWKNGDTIIETDEGVTIGSTPSFDGETPTKETDENFGYTFDGWDDGTTVYAADALPIVSGAVTYTAHYSTAPTVASVKVGSNTTYYTNFADAWETVNSATDEVTLKLLGDVSGIAASLVYSGTQNCTFDLNNHTLSGTVTKLIDVNATGKTFTINDSSAEQDGMISMIGTGNARRNALYITAGTVHLMQGKIYGKNTSTYNSSSAKAVSAAGVEIANGGQFTMDGGTVESESQYLSYALYINKSTSSVVEINRGLIKGHTNKGTTACGIYNSSTKLTINNGHIVGHAWTNTSYGLYNYYGKATINGGIIEATNDTINGKGTTKAYGISTAYSSSTYTGAITIPSTSTVEVYARTNTTTAIAVVIGSGSTGSTIAGGKFTAKAGTTTARGISSAGNITVSGGTFYASTATTGAYGIYATGGTVTVNGNPTFNVTAGTTTAYGALAYGTIGKKGTGKYSGTIQINGGTFNVTSTETDAYGASAALASRDLRKCSATNDTVPGLHYMPGILEVTDGTFNVKATTTTAYGVHVAKAKSESGTVGTTARIPLGTVTGGKFKVESMGDANATAYAMNSATTAARLVVQGGYYNTKRTDASETSNIEDKYTAPTKSCNYRVLPLDDATYKYEVAEAYTVTFNANGHGTAPASQLIIKGQKATEPTALTATGYTFGGWYKEAGCTNEWDFASDVVTAATPLYAKWTVNTHKLAWNFDGGTPSGAYTEANNALAYGSAITYPTLSKTGYTFAGWSSDATSMPDADLTITASWTVNTHKLAWNFDDGTPSGAYTEANNALAYGSAITYPTLSKTGYTFAGWSSDATSMPDADLTITASWTPNTNTAYTVKHYKQKLDGTYAATPDETDNLTGTTGAEVTPAVKDYTGFTAPSTQTVTILADGSLVVEYYYTRNSHKVTWDATTNGGSCETAYSMVKHGATIGTLPVATKTGHEFQGWFTTYSGGGNPVTSSAVINFAITYYARFTPSTYDITYKDQNDIEFSGVQGSGYPTTHTYGTATALVNPTKAGYTFDGWYDNADCTGSALTEIGATAYTADFTLYAKWTIKSNCTIRWENYDGTLLCESTIQREGTPNYPNHGPVPTKPGDANRTYTFIGWSPEIHAAYDDETYTAQYSMSITTGEPGTYTVSGAEDAVATTVQVTGALHIPEDNSLTTGDLIVEASAGESGTIDGIERVTVTGDAYFDYEFNVDPWHWSAFGVPFEIDLDAAAPLKEKTSPLGIVGPDDYDIVYYDTEERAANGASKNCWKYVDNETHRLIPGRLYMIAFDKHVGHVGVLRFKKATSAPVNCTTPVQLITTGPAGGNHNWNGIANPMMYHALLGAGVTECQVHDGGEIGKDGYYTYDMNNKKFFVGKAAFVQVPQNQDPVVVSQATSQDPIVVKAPRRTKASVATENRYDIQIAPSNEAAEDRLLVLAEEDKADEYVIVSDLAKAGVSPVRAQMWVDRYSEKLCKNTTAFINNKADYPLVISTPKVGEYDLFINEQPDDETMLYLTYDGNAIWNLSYGGYVVHLEKGTTTHYGLRIVRTPKVSTGIEETTIQNGEAIRKVIVDDKVYIIRNNEIYSITGQKAQ